MRFIAAALFLLLPQTASAMTDDLAMLCAAELEAGSKRAVHRDWSPDCHGNFPLPHTATNFAGGPMDLPALGGPSLGSLRPFSTAVVAIVLDENGKLVRKPRTHEKGREAYVYDIDHDWPVLTPYELGDLTPYVAARFDREAALAAPREYRLMGPNLVTPTWLFSAAATVPEDWPRFPKNADRFPAILVDRSGSLVKGERVFGFRYPILRVGPGSSGLATGELCTMLKMTGKPGIVFRRPLDTREAAQLEHLVRTSDAEMRRLRQTGGASADTTRRTRELRAFRYVEVPPVPTTPDLLHEGYGAPRMPESAALFRRFDGDGVGTEHRYAYYAAGERLVEIVHARSGWTLRALLQPGESRAPEWHFTDLDFWKTRRHLHFAGDFVLHYLGE